MSYTRPAYNAADASWLGSAAYTRPAFDAADAGWSVEVVSAALLVAGPLGSASVVGEYIAAAVIDAAALVSGPLGGLSASAHVVVTAAASVAGPLGAATIHSTVQRYELRGAVRSNGVLVNRRVRAYRRDTGAMAGEADTVLGRFIIPAGSAPAEHYLIPIDLDAGASDYAPPAANRVVSVLAQDAP